MEPKYIVILILFLFLLTPSKAFADRGLISISPGEVYLEETGQHAIIAWNGTEEILILSTDVKSSKSTYILEVLPLPSNPSEVTEGNFGSFENLTKIFNEKVRELREYSLRGAGLGGMEKPGVEITFHNRIGVHDVTVVKVSDIDEFINWVRSFLTGNGLEYIEISSGFKDAVSRYLDRGINYFVFDIIEADINGKSVEPLIYRFKSDYLYYPLEITAASDTGSTYSKISIFLITYGRVDEDLIREAGFNPRSGFKYYIEFNKSELDRVNPLISGLFNAAYVMYIDFHGPLNILNRDFIIYRSDIYIPTLLDKIYIEFIRCLGPTILYQFISSTWSEILNIYNPIFLRIFLTIILVSFITGILSTIYIINLFLKSLIRRYDLKLHGLNILAYIVPIIIVTYPLILNPNTLSVTISSIIVIIGLSTLIFITMKLLGKYVV